MRMLSEIIDDSETCEGAADEDAGEGRMDSEFCTSWIMTVYMVNSSIRQELYCAKSRLVESILDR